MIKIFTNNRFVPEKRYIIETIFGEYLGVSSEIVFKDHIVDYVIEMPSGKQIVIKDGLFNLCTQDDVYLKQENIPSKVKSLEHSFGSGGCLPIIYGDDELKIGEDRTICGLDIFASVFYMLTRFEEYVLKDRDAHDRFPAKKALSVRACFQKRAVVDEYVDFLCEMMIYSGYKMNKERERVLNIIPTHDVDHLRRWGSLIAFTKNSMSYILRKGATIRDIKTLMAFYWDVKTGKKDDPFDTFDFLMDESETRGTKSYFFFKASATSKFDSGYDICSDEARKAIGKIISRGHHIGIHPGYYTYNKKDLMEKEIEGLSFAIGGKVEFGRQHYLRFEAPTTWQILEDVGIKWDSTVGYPEVEGFRAGTCRDFPVFNFLTRKKLKLREKPLIFMDQTLTSYQLLNQKQIFDTLDGLKKTVQRHHGDLVFLWHNSSFDPLYFDREQCQYSQYFKSIAF